MSADERPAVTMKRWRRSAADESRSRAGGAAPTELPPAWAGGSAVSSRISPAGSAPIDAPLRCAPLVRHEANDGDPDHDDGGGAPAVDLRGLLTVRDRHARLSAPNHHGATDEDSDHAADDHVRLLVREFDLPPDRRREFRRPVRAGLMPMAGSPLSGASLVLVSRLCDCLSSLQSFELDRDGRGGGDRDGRPVLWNADVQRLGADVSVVELGEAVVLIRRRKAHRNSAG